MSALDATAVIGGPENAERRITVAAFVRGVRSTDLGAGEILRALEIPLDSLRSKVAFRRIALSNLGRSGSLVIGRVAPSGEHVYTVTAATTRPAQLRFAGAPTAGELAEAIDGIHEWYDDPHGAPDWREAVTRAFAEEIRAELEGDAR
jgi:CO/xanthine dehydrogenase FAD-binding subunit